MRGKSKFLGRDIILGIIFGSQSLNLGKLKRLSRLFLLCRKAEQFIMGLGCDEETGTKISAYAVAYLEILGGRGMQCKLNH